MQVREPQSDCKGAAAAAAFALFARTRDHRAFTTAFDATAPNLLVVAERLSRGRIAADDLLQDTWLHAIRRASHYDPNRPLLPWLIGILVLVAKHRRRTDLRAERRDAAVSIDTARPTKIPSPFTTAATAEFDAAVAEALGRMDERLRLVLVLRLVHGMSSTDIGRALGRAPDTVRQQIARGLARLRRLLPAGYALPAFAFVDGLAGDRLGILRTALLTQMPAAAFLGVLTMKALVGGGIAVLLLVLAMAVYLSRDDVSGAELHLMTAAANVDLRDDVANNLSGSDGAPEAVTTPERQAVDLRSPVDAQSNTTNVIGRCVDDAGLPLADVAVTLRHVDRPQMSISVDTGTEQSSGALMSQMTGSDGRFRFAVSGALSRFWVELKAGGRATRSGEIPSEGDLGDLLVPLAQPLHGRFVDVDGAPLRLPTAIVSLRAPMTRLDAWSYHLVSSGIQMTDAETFITKPIFAGPWRAMLFAPGWFAEPVTLVHGAGAEVVFVCREIQPLRGVVVDEKDRPIEGAQITVDPIPPSRSLSFKKPVMTGADGRFVLQYDGSIDPADEVILRVEDGMRDRFAVAKLVVRYGGPPIRCVIERLGSLSVAVVDAESGAPIVGAVVGWITDPASAYANRQKTAPNGVANLTGLPAGEVRLLACGPDDRHAISESVVHGVLNDGNTPHTDLVVRLTEAPLRYVRVVDGDGTGLDGVTVECIDPIGREVTAGVHARKRVSSVGISFLNPIDIVKLVGSGTTDRSGVASVRVTDAGPIGVLRLSGDGIATTILRAPFRGTGTDTDPFRVVAERPGKVEVCVADGPSESVRFLLVRDVGAVFEVHPSFGEPVVADVRGVATFTGVPAGFWQVRLQRFGAVSTRDGVPLALATVNVVSGSSVSVPVDLRQVTPGRLKTIVEPRDDEPLVLKAMDYVHTFKIEPIAGHVMTEAMFPGRYRIVRPSDGASTTFTLLPGTTYREPLRLVK